MSTFRRTWLALLGAILILTLSVSAAFGAKPSADSNRGQSVAAFVHDLIFGSEETDEEPTEDPAEDEDEDEDEQEDSDEEDSDEEDSEEEDSEEDAEEEDSDEEASEDETSERQVPEEFANHGECVSAAAQDSDGFAESEAKNRGEWVSMHARYVCWGLEVPGEETDEESAEDADEAEEEGDADQASAKEQRKTDRDAAKAERKAGKAAAKAARKASKGH